MDLFTGESRLVSVLPLDGGGRPYAYRVPAEWADKAVPGALAVVPLGRSTRTGIVWRAGSDEPVPEAKLKDLAKILHDAPVFSPDMPKLVSWISGYYAAPLNSVLESVLPAVIRRGVKPVVRRSLEIARVPEPEFWERMLRRAPKRAAVFTFVRNAAGPVSRDGVVASAGVIDSLIRDGFFREIAGRVDREAYGDEAGHGAPAEAPDLNDEQRAAAAAIGAAIAAGAHRTLLLHGVTGSGKTEVYLDAILRALAAGGSALFLVPEVALTPQTVGRLRSRLAAGGHRVVVWHSRLSDGERFDAWMAVARGDCRVVVGARSAVFMPLKKLRVVVVDEEHESSFKQERRRSTTAATSRSTGRA